MVTPPLLAGLLATAALAADSRAPQAEAAVFAAAPPATGPYAASPGVDHHGQHQPLGFWELIHVGDRPGDSALGFGTLKDHQGRPGLNPNHRPFSDLCNEADFNTVLDGAAGLQLVTHFECTRGAFYRSSIVLEGGRPVVRDTRYDGVLDAVGGVMNPCAGQRTPWGSLLSSEEYEPEARDWDPAEGHEMVEYAGRMVKDWATAGLSLAFTDLRQTSPYRYGWIPELAATGAAGALEGSKHYAMGRFSHEMALVLPDRRTVYLSDDGSLGVGWFLFVADTPGDLSAGTLYAAQWTADESGGPLAWVNLGHATDEELSPWVETPGAIAFDDLFQTATPVDGHCPAPTRLTRAKGRVECLALAPDRPALPEVALLASRLETRRTAALRGATLELRKGEGVAWDGRRKQVYLAISSVDGDMLPDAPHPDDAVRIPRNRCGGIFAGEVAAGQRDTDGRPIPSAHVMTALRPVLLGREDGDKGCTDDSLANPDNIVFDDALDTLFIAEDTRQHDRNLLWAWRPGAQDPTAVFRAPPGAEVTGLHLTAPLGSRPLAGEPGSRWLLISVQHPSGGTTGEPFDPALEGTPHGARADDGRSFVGALGPLP